jgi:hypothetical protein
MKDGGASQLEHKCGAAVRPCCRASVPSARKPRRAGFPPNVGKIQRWRAANPPNPWQTGIAGTTMRETQPRQGKEALNSSKALPLLGLR